MMILLRLYWEFFKVGLFSFGGGMAAIPFLYDISDKTGWFTYEDLTNMIAISESTPGPIGANMATYVGYVTGMDAWGLPGAVLGGVLATLGFATPSMVLVLLLASLLAKYRTHPRLNAAFYGLRPASAGLIAAAGLLVASKCLLPAGLTAASDFIAALTADPLAALNWKGLLLAAAIWLLSNKVKATKGLHPIVFIGLAAAAGIVFGM